MIYRFTATALLCLGTVLPAAAGPPLATEDVGVLEQGQWEIITATTSSSRDSLDVYQAPLLDVSLGVWGDSLQIAAAYPYVYLDRDDGSSDSEFGNLEVGAKWRFWNQGDLQMAFAPTYAFGVTRKNAIRGIGDEGDVAFLPLALEYQITERWRINTMAGYASVEDDRDQWEYGAALAYGLDSRWELLFELAGATDNDFDDDSLNIRAGFDFAIRDDLHLLFAAATGLREAESEEELDYDLFIGLQWFR